MMIRLNRMTLKTVRREYRAAKAKSNGITVNKYVNFLVKIGADVLLVKRQHGGKK